MFEQTTVERLATVYGIEDLVPQVILNKSTQELRRALHLVFSEEVDDLDYYEGAAVIVDHKYPVAIRHYRGHPPEMVTIYLPSKFKDVEEITRVIREVLAGLKIDPDAIQWERRMGLRRQ